MRIKTYESYIQRCIEHCSSRISSDFFESCSKQSNTLRVEILRDTSDRCGMKPPEHWSQSAKDRGWGMWVLCGGSPCVFGHCNKNCPMMPAFIRSAPKKAWREMKPPEVTT